MTSSGTSASHVFVPCHWGVEVKVRDVHGHEFGIGHADDAMRRRFMVRKLAVSVPASPGSRLLITAGIL